MFSETTSRLAETSREPRGRGLPRDLRDLAALFIEPRSARSGNVGETFEETRIPENLGSDLAGEVRELPGVDSRETVVDRREPSRPAGCCVHPRAKVSTRRWLT